LFSVQILDFTNFVELKLTGPQAFGTWNLYDLTLSVNWRGLLYRLCNLSTMITTNCSFFYAQQG